MKTILVVGMDMESYFPNFMVINGFLNPFPNFMEIY